MGTRRHSLKRLLMATVAVLSLVPLVEKEAESRPYDYSLGIRLGNYFAAEGKFFFSMTSAMDISFGLMNPFTPEYQFLLLSGAYNLHLTRHTSGLIPYIGTGLSTGLQFGDRNRSLRASRSFFLSADIPLGIEYKLRNSPVLFCLEWSPKVRFLKDIRFLPQSISVGFRYTFY